jgi:hypothetical protein
MTVNFKPISNLSEVDALDQRPPLTPLANVVAREIVTIYYAARRLMQADLPDGTRCTENCREIILLCDRAACQLGLSVAEVRRAMEVIRSAEHKN